MKGSGIREHYIYGSLEAVNYIKEPANLSDDHMNFIEASIIFLFSWKL